MKTFYWYNLKTCVLRAYLKPMRWMFPNSLIIIPPISFYAWKELFVWGPSFSYKGDEVVWDWRKKRWTSICCEGIFPTLAAVDEFWKEYESHCNQ